MNPHKIPSLIALSVLGVLALSVLSAEAAKPSATHQFRSQRKPGDVDRVDGLIEIGGNLKEVVDNKVQTLALSVENRFGYDERTLEVPSIASGRWRSIRDYDKLDTSITLDGEATQPTLRDQRRLIGVSVELPQATLYSPQGTLRRDELDLLDTVADTLLWDHLLPERPVAVGDSWDHADPLMAAWLGLDAVKANSVKSVLTEVTDTVARMEISGTVEGAIGGVATQIELKAKYRFDLRRKRVDWLGLLVKERRSVGHVERGVDAVTRFQATVAPKTTSARLTDAALAGMTLTPTDALSRISLESPQSAWQTSSDRLWYVIGERRDLTVLRRVERGELIAQCNVSPLPKLQPGTQLTLPEFQADVKTALGESFGEFVESRQWANEADYRVFRVVVRGVVSELPIRWNYYLVADEQGHQAAFAFTVEEQLLERLGQADEQLVSSFRFLEPKVAAKP